jgi:hypothetical protein
MMIVYFFYGLSFGGLGLAAYLQLRRGGDFPPALAASLARGFRLRQRVNRLG